MITPENLSEIFEYHAWSPEQVKKGNAIRAAAKKSALALFALRAAALEMRDAIVQSAPEQPPASESLADYAKDRRSRALTRLDVLVPAEDMVQSFAADLNEIVMIANSAITFEAPRLEPQTPELAHTERIEAAV